jgi:signal transduction histidine kinase
LASGVAHEINNPLGGLFNCVKMLGQNIDNGPLREKYLGLMHEGLDRIENTVNRLLWMSRRREGTPVDVNVRNAIESIGSFLDYKMRHAAVSFSNEAGKDLVIPFDLHDFQQLLLNLFINAIQAMKDGGTLTVRGYRKDSQVVIEVADTGIGMARETVGRIFDPFFTTKPPGEGTGLGLWLTYEIVQNYGGEISVESEEWKGSTFRLSFPADGGGMS